MDEMKTAPGVGAEEKIYLDTDRLGLAYCRANCFEWDDLFGEKPKGFDEMPAFPEAGDSLDLMNRNYLTKFDFVHPVSVAIEEMIGKSNISRCWWKYQEIGSEEEWARWYLRTRGITTEQIERRQKLLENPPKQCPKRFGKKGTHKGSKYGKHPFVAALCFLFSFFLLGIFFGLLLKLVEML